MKSILVILCLTIATVSFAKEMDKKKFEKRKAKTIEMADKTIADLKQLKTCVSAATEKESLKKCQETHREKMQVQMKKRKEMREKRKEKRKSKKKE